jgi:outer membrane protein assembly factor BamB
VLQCLRVSDGEVVWRRDYVKEFGTVMPTWGIAGAPVVDGERLIAIVGGQPDAKVVAFDKRTGKEKWRALAGTTEQGYSQPVITTHGGKRMAIVWHAGALTALDPETGKTVWEQEFKINLAVALGTPVVAQGKVLVSAFYNGSLLMDLAGKMLWRGKSASEINTDGLHAVVNTPVIDGGHVYGICSYGQFRCLRLDTGERVWETMEVTKEKARWASGFIVKNGDRYFINNDRGELIIARLKPTGYEEISRAKLIAPTTNPGNRRELGNVNWTHPAYANRHLYTRNDEEVIAVDLGK